IWVGTLLIVKADDAVSVSQLSPAQQQQLEQSPHLAMSPGEIKAALRLSPAETPRFQAEPALTFGQPRIALVADDELPPEVWRRADLLELRLTGVAVPFSLEEPPEECWCTE